MDKIKASQSIENETFTKTHKEDGKHQLFMIKKRLLGDASTDKLDSQAEKSAGSRYQPDFKWSAGFNY